MLVAERFAFLLEIREFIVRRVFIRIDRGLWQDMLSRHVEQSVMAF
jgi:hypothetical protein